MMIPSSARAHGVSVCFVRFATIAGIGLVLAQPTSAPAQASSQAEWVVPARRAARPNPVQVSPQVLTQGRDLYSRECASCHGRAGRGDGPKARQLHSKVSDLSGQRVQQQSDGALFYKITEGRGNMPSNKTSMSEEERWVIVRYLRTLAATKS